MHEEGMSLFLSAEELVPFKKMWRAKGADGYGEYSACEPSRVSDVSVLGWRPRGSFRWSEPPRICAVGEPSRALYRK